MSDVSAKKRKLSEAMSSLTGTPMGTPCVIVCRERVTANRSSIVVEVHKFSTQRAATRKTTAWIAQRNGRQWTYNNTYFPHDVDVEVYARDRKSFIIVPTKLRDDNT